MDMDKKQYESWLLKNEIKAVVFNEQHYWQPIIWTKYLNVKCIAYIDYYTAETLPFFNIYDELWCNTKKHQSAFKSHPNVQYIPWGTDTTTFKPSLRSPKDSIVFFHSAGMAAHRKGTDFLISALYKLYKSRKEFKAVIHTQRDIIEIFPSLEHEVNELVSSKHLLIEQKTVAAPGLYHMGNVYVYPARLDGIGLTVAEAVSCGLGVIVPNNGPMNEFISDDFGRETVIDKFQERDDGYFWPMCFVDEHALESDLLWFIDNADSIQDISKAARKHAEENLNFYDNFSKVVDDLDFSYKRTVDIELIKDIDLFERKKSRFFKSVPPIIRFKTKIEKRIKTVFSK
jgi:glycosyltransferase involved in cell wall biosynthesis